MSTEQNAMQITKHRCDGPSCNREAEDRYMELGWISFGRTTSGCSDLSVFLGRGEHQAGRCAFFSRLQDLDFCCLNCFVEWLIDFVGDEAVKKNIALDIWDGHLKVRSR